MSKKKGLYEHEGQIRLLHKWHDQTMGKNTQKSVALERVFMGMLAKKMVFEHENL